MASSRSSRSDTKDENWSRFAKSYDPIKIGSIDGTDTEPHDKGIIRALLSDYQPNRHVKGRAECTIFVSRLNLKTTKDTIKDVFSKYGRLRRFRLVKDIVTGIPKGYAFIEYESEMDAEEAYQKANKLNIDGNHIFVDFECERLLKGWKPRRLGGGFGGQKESGQLRFGGRDRPFMKPISLAVKDRKDRDSRRRNRSRSRGRSRERSRDRSRGRSRDSRNKRSRSHRDLRRSRSKSNSKRPRRSRSRGRSNSRSK